MTRDVNMVDRSSNRNRHGDEITTLEVDDCKLGTNSASNGGRRRAQEEAMAATTTKGNHSSVERVIQTNDQCTVSKRSVEALYCPEPHFYRYFVKKRKSRSPLVNRVYWLRMQTMERKVKRWLGDSAAPRKVVINLGCGYDALPFRLLAQERDSCQGVTFVDLDYPDVVESKAKVIASTHQLSGLLNCVAAVPKESYVKHKSQEYMALACDLADVSDLAKKIEAEIDCVGSTFLVVAEVSLVYMSPGVADRLIQWAAGLGNVSFFLLERTLPRGPEYPFAKKFLQHYSQTQSPLLGLKAYPGIEDQKRRFQKAGFWNVSAWNMWDLWSSPEVFAARERAALQHIEPFDEWEDFAIFAAHCLFLQASTSGPYKRIEPALPGSLGISTPPLFGVSGGSMSPRSGSAIDGPSVDSFCKPEVTTCAPRSHGALYQVGEGLLEYHGGYDGSSRLAWIDAYAANGAEPSTYEFTRPPAVARQFHTVTTFNSNFDCLMAGGRKAPRDVLSECWLRRNGEWTLTDPLPRPLYRHAATSLKDRGAVLIYGGKSIKEAVSNDWYLWEDNKGWRQLDVASRPRSPRFGAMIAQLDSEHFPILAKHGGTSEEFPSGILTGGMAEDGTVTNEPVLWAVDDTQVWIDGIPANYKQSDAFSRFGAIAKSTPLGLVIVGGFTRHGLPARGTGDVVLCQVSQQDNGGPTWKFSAAETPEIYTSALLMGHSVIWDGDGIAIVGGGVSCFTAGPCMNSTLWRVQKKEGKQTYGQWKLITGKAYAATVEPAPKRHKSAHDSSLPVDRATPPAFQQPDRRTLDKDHIAREILRNSKPCVIEHADFGSCTRKWTTEYLKRTIGGDRMLEVHICDAKHMTFLDKNFRIERKRCNEFFDSIAQGQFTYLRAVSLQDKREPAHFRKDFPTLAGDFAAPRGLNSLPFDIHSSVLRISGQVNMWLHYDVLPNVLCQIRGTKRVILFPPLDVTKLSIPAGASSSNIDVFGPRAFRQMPLADTSPVEVYLKAGEALFIPAFWCHAVSPMDAFSVAINLFLDAQHHSSGVDTWGNQDSRLYTGARERLSKTCAHFANRPLDERTFYLLRLAKEFQKMVDSEIQSTD